MGVVEAGPAMNDVHSLRDDIDVIMGVVEAGPAMDDVHSLHGKLSWYGTMHFVTPGMYTLLT